MLDRCHNASIVKRRLDSVSGIAFRCVLNGEERVGEIKKRYRIAPAETAHGSASAAPRFEGIRAVFHRELFQDSGKKGAALRVLPLCPGYGRCILDKLFEEARSDASA